MTPSSRTEEIEIGVPLRFAEVEPLTIASMYYIGFMANKKGNFVFREVFPRKKCLICPVIFVSNFPNSLIY